MKLIFVSIKTHSIDIRIQYEYQSEYKNYFNESKFLMTLK